MLLGYFDRVTRDRKKSIKFLPLVGSLFLFILVSNWVGLLPGIGSIGFWEIKEGAKEFIPLFRLIFLILSRVILSDIL
jgi:F-type H+-transporting ATPase subunit a